MSQSSLCVIDLSHPIIVNMSDVAHLAASLSSAAWRGIA
jgi:hypothetical protein